LIVHGELSGKAAKQVLEIIFVDGGDVDEIIDGRNLRMVTDRESIRDWVKTILDRSPGQAESYRKERLQ
jgi:Asp-tRNA(Asn)/Glu-tRNA(Gln) amidotransferase B subunit